MLRNAGFMPLLLSTLLLGVPFGAFAETVYVIDQLLVGVHAEKNLESAIIKVLPTGTQLEILERDGELARVKDNENTEGWIDTAYLMDNPPARLMVERLERANTSLQQQLDTAKNTSQTDSQASPDRSSSEKLMKENTELKRKLSNELINSAKLNEKVNSFEARLSGQPLSAAETQVTELEKTIVELKRDLEQSVQTNKALEAKNRESLGDMMPKVDMDMLSWPVLIGALVALAIAYGGGIYTMDYLNRRRHGGFRV